MLFSYTLTDNDEYVKKGLADVLREGWFVSSGNEPLFHRGGLWRSIHMGHSIIYSRKFLNFHFKKFIRIILTQAD